MRKTIALVAVGLLALFVVARSTGVGSYVKTMLCQAKQAVKDQVPTNFDIERIRQEIASLDQDLDRMIDPVAKYTQAVNRLEQEITQKEKRLGEDKKVLLDATAAVKSGKDPLPVGDKMVPAAKVKQKIAEQFKKYQSEEKYVEARKTELEAKQATLKAANDQLNAFLQKKQEFKVLLAQLEAEHAVNQAAAVGTDLKLDSTRAAQIAHDLDELKDKIESQRAALKMKADIVAANDIQLEQLRQQPVDLEAIQAHLEGKALPKTASNK